MSLRFLTQFKQTTRLLIQNQSKLNQSCFKLVNNLHQSCPSFYAAPLQIKMPSLSPTMTEGNIVKWLKKEGDQVAPGDVLMEIQTDKAVIAFETEEEGTIAKIIVPDDSKNIQVGTLVGLIALPGDDWKSVSVPEASQTATKVSSTSPVQQTQTTQTESHSQHELPQRIGPAARHLIMSYQIDPNQIKPTGPHGFILKSDVKAYIEQNRLTPKVESESVKAEPQQQATVAPVSTPKKSANVHPEYEPDYEDIELSNMRKVIAKRLVFSKTSIPHSYVTANCIADKIVELRKEMIKNNQKVSLNDFITKAVALALRMVPELNSNIDEKTGAYTQLQTVDISTAVATDKGLITPIIKNADKISVLNISENVKQLADKARQGKLQPHEFQGGSFTISNLGMFGISEFSAVINPPQIAILAVGRSQLKLNQELKKQTHISLTLSFDERCCSLDRAMRFLTTLNYFIENPEILIEQNQSL